MGYCSYLGDGKDKGALTAIKMNLEGQNKES